MTRLHLIRKEDSAPVGQPFGEGGWIPNPEVRLMRLGAPAKAGWENEAYRAVAVTDAPKPAEGKRRVGEVRRAYDEKTGTVVESYLEEDIPPPVVRTPAEKYDRLLADYGLTREEFEAEAAKSRPVEPVART